MSVYVSKHVRAFVAERAGFRCEYCHVRQADAFIAFEIDHIISLKHGGTNEIENLALACPHFNSNKGSDLATFIESYDDIVPLFNPRVQQWKDHFYGENGEIVGRSKIGQATIKVLQLNDPDRIIIRNLLEASEYWPD